MSKSDSTRPARPRRRGRAAASNGQAETPPYRLNVNLTPTTVDELHRLKAETGQTMTNLVRLAFTLLDLALRGRAQGYRLALVDDSGRLVRELVLPV